MRRRTDPAGRAGPNTRSVRQLAPPDTAPGAGSVRQLMPPIDRKDRETTDIAELRDHSEISPLGSLVSPTAAGEAGQEPSD